MLPGKIFLTELPLNAEMEHENHVFAHKSAKNGRTEMLRTVLESSGHTGSGDTNSNPFLKGDLPGRSARRSRRSPRKLPQGPRGTHKKFQRDILKNGREDPTSGPT